MPCNAVHILETLIFPFFFFLEKTDNFSKRFHVQKVHLIDYMQSFLNNLQYVFMSDILMQFRLIKLRQIHPSSTWITLNRIYLCHGTIC